MQLIGGCWVSGKQGRRPRGNSGWRTRGAARAEPALIRNTLGARPICCRGPRFLRYSLEPVTLIDLHIGTTGSTVPTSSLDRARATSMPDAA